jgi:hypothetical protein
MDEGPPSPPHSHSPGLDSRPSSALHRTGSHHRVRVRGQRGRQRPPQRPPPHVDYLARGAGPLDMPCFGHAACAERWPGAGCP